MELRAEGDTRAITAALTGRPGVHEVLVDGRRVSVRAEDGAAAVPVLLAALERAGAAVAAATVARPSLDDVCLRYAGRRFSEAEAAGSPALTPQEAPDEQPSLCPDAV